MKKTLVLTSLLAIVATTGAATAADLTMTDIKDSMNMVVSDGSYSIGGNDYNVNDNNYSTSDYYSLYTYDHDGNPGTDEISLTSNNGGDSLDLSVFTYKDNSGNNTDLGTNATGFVENDFKVSAGTVDGAHGTSNLVDLEVNGTVGVDNYQYMADFTGTGTESLTALTADEPTLGAFSKEITLANGETLVVTGGSDANKPNETQYEFEIGLQNSTTGVFGIEWNEDAQQYNYVYKGHKEGGGVVSDDYVLTETDKDNAKNGVTAEKGHLLADIANFEAATVDVQANYDSAKAHYDAVHAVYLADVDSQEDVDTRWTNYTTTFETANNAKDDAADSLANAQSEYAADLAVYTSTKNAYDNYDASLGKIIDERAEAVGATSLQNAKDYTDDAIATAVDGKQDTLTAAQQSAVDSGITADKVSAYDDYATEIAGKQDALTAAQQSAVDSGITADKVSAYDDYATEIAGKQDALTAAQQSAVDSGITATKVNQYDDVVEHMGTIHGLVTSAGATTTSTGKAYHGNLAVGTTMEDHLLALDEAIGDRRTLSGNHVSATGSVTDNLQSLNDDLDTEVARAQAEEASIRSDFAAADALTLSNAKSYADSGDALTLNAAKAYADNASAFNLQAAKAYTDERIHKLDKDLSAGVANAVALSSVAVSNVERGEVSVGAGYGYYNGQSAMAFGAAMGLSNRWSINAGAGLSGSDFSIRAGTNYKFKLF